jgi:hypothetical protein
MNIINFIDLTLSHLGDTIHTLTTESKILILPPNPFPTIPIFIYNSLPKPLPDADTIYSPHQIFAEFFTKSLPFTYDPLLASINNASVITKLEVQTQNIVLASALQFRGNIDIRFTQIINIFHPRNKTIKIPNFLLFRPTQNPSSFINLIKNYIPYPDESTLAELFIILQHEKASLVQDISVIFNISTTRPPITRSQYLQIQRKFNQYSINKNLPPQKILSGVTLRNKTILSPISSIAI